MPAVSAAQPANAPGQRPVAARRQRHYARPAAAASTRTVELEGGGAVVVVPTRRRPKGVVHFLGGAFVAAVPRLSYSLLLERLADGGYTCVATPYAVTFRHVECAQATHAAFASALGQLRGGAAPLGAWAAPAGLPLHGVGHSNGALLHLLIGALCPPEGGDRASNVLISYNNKQVAEAVPVPLGALQPAVQQLRGGDRLGAAAARGLREAAQAATRLLEAPGGAASPWQRQGRQLLGSLQQLDPALVQLGSVFDEVGDGLQDFSPSPAEARQLIAASYSVPSTLLVQFTNDGIDESPTAEAVLRGAPQSGAAPPRSVRRLALPGTHITPCGGAPGAPLPRGTRFGPAEALGMAAAALLAADVNRLADRLLQHLDAHS